MSTHNARSDDARGLFDIVRHESVLVPSPERHRCVNEEAKVRGRTRSIVERDHERPAREEYWSTDAIGQWLDTP